MKKSSRTAGHRAVIAAVLPALALAACNKPAAQTTDNGPVTNSVAPLAALPATLPMTNDTAATPLAAAPAASALPAAPAPRVVRVADPRQSYAYADRAAAMSGAVDRAPPDYAFDYGGVQPWAWRAGDGSTEVVEPVGGGYRHYYYEPGASRPYLVRDPDYAYGYDNGDLAAVYGPDGRYIPPADYRGRPADYAGRYLVRGAALIAAAAAVAHYGVSVGHWRSHRAGLSAENARWHEQQQRQADWRAYHDAHAAAERDHWNREQAARDDRAERFDRWQRSDFQVPSPGADRGGSPRDGNERRADEERQQQDQRPVVDRSQDEARRQQWLHDQQQRQIADQRDDARQQAAADSVSRRQSAERADQAHERAAADRQRAAAQRQQVADWRRQAADQRQQVAAQRQQTANQRQELADQRQQRAAFDRQQPAAQRRQGIAPAGIERDDQDRAQDWRSAGRDHDAPTRAAQADYQRSSPSARFAPSALDTGSARPVRVDRPRGSEDAAPAGGPHAQSAPPRRPVVLENGSPHAHAAETAPMPSRDRRADAHTEAGQEHGRERRDH